MFIHKMSKKMAQCNKQQQMWKVYKMIIHLIGFFSAYISGVLQKYYVVKYFFHTGQYQELTIEYNKQSTTSTQHLVPGKTSLWRFHFHQIHGYSSLRAGVKK